MLYCAEVEVDRRDPDPEHMDVMLDSLRHYAPAVSSTPRGFVSVVITFPAASLQQAASTALAVVEVVAQASPLRLEVMTEEEFNARGGFEPVPELVGATTAAGILGVSRQRVQQLSDEGKLPGQLVGRSLVFPRSAVEAFRDRAGKGTVTVSDDD